MRSIFIYALLLFILIALLDSPVEAKKRKKGKKKAASSKSSPKKPEGTSPELYCNVCQAIVKEQLKKLKHRKSETDVIDSLSDVCDPKYYYIYMFPPPEMKEGCQAFIMDWEEDLERVLMEREKNSDVEQTICYDISKACVNVDVEADTPRMPEEIWIDGQPQPIDAESGKVDLGQGDL